MGKFKKVLALVASLCVMAMLVAGCGADKKADNGGDKAAQSDAPKPVRHCNAGESCRDAAEPGFFNGSGDRISAGAEKHVWQVKDTRRVIENAKANCSGFRVFYCYGWCRFPHAGGSVVSQPL